MMRRLLSLPRGVLGVRWSAILCATLALAGCSTDCGRRLCAQPGVHLALGSVPSVSAATICVDNLCSTNQVEAHVGLAGADAAFARQVQVVSNLPQGKRVTLSIVLMNAAGVRMYALTERRSVAVYRNACDHCPGFWYQWKSGSLHWTD